MRIPLGVRLSNERIERNVTRDLRDLTLRSVIPGGFASIEFSLNRPLKIDADELIPFTRVQVYDERNGNIVNEGRIEDPGRGVSNDGQVWEVTALGPSAHAFDRTLPLNYIDTSFEAWGERFGDITSNGINFESRVERRPDSASGTPAAQAIVFSIPDGLAVVVNDRKPLRYLRLYDSDQKLARFDYQHKSSFSSTDWHIQAVTRELDIAAGEAPRDDAVSTTISGLDPKVVVTDFPNGRETLDLRLIIVSGAPATTDSEWTYIIDLVIIALRLDREGNEITTGYNDNFVLASEIVEDLLGRVLTNFDGETANIETSTFEINQLTYPDGVTAGKVLDDLISLEPTFYWAAWESTATGGGKNRFEWREWDTTVRYNADISDGFSSPGSTSELFNAVTVRWVGKWKRIQRTRRTQLVDALDDNNLVREGFIDLGDDLGSEENAIRVGDQFLIEHAVIPNRGTLTIARPIVDLQTGRVVMPWEILPGFLIRVRGVQPRVDALNPDGRDSVTIFKIVSVEFKADTGVAELELDSHPPTVAREIADLSRNRITRRR